MPGILAHYLCGNRMLRLTQNRALADIAARHPQVFNLGTQGPDILFYNIPFPWKKGIRINRAGSKMHRSNTGTLFANALQYIKNQNNNEKELLTAYICGYACHYALDLHTHPYIYYKTGFVRKNEHYTLKYKCYHRMFETAIDVLMLDLEMSKKPHEINPSALIHIKGSEADVIGKMYKNVLKSTYNINIGVKQVRKAIFDMIYITSILRDRSGLKKRLLSALETSAVGCPYFSSLIHPISINDGLDYLNLSKSTWFLPWDINVAINKSFIELFEDAVQEAKTLCEMIVDHVFNSFDPEMDNLFAKYCSRSFSTGMDYNLEVEFKFFDCIFEH